MASQKYCEKSCDHHALQRSLYRHALNSLQLASRSGCGSERALELAKRCEELLRAAEHGELQVVDRSPAAALQHAARPAH